MVSDAATGEASSIPEDTVDLGGRPDPVRTLLRRTARGDQRAAGALVDVLCPRIHGLAVHVTGSAARAENLTVEVLRTCLRDAAELAASPLPGDAAVLDRARRAVVATRPSGDVPSLLSPAAASDRTSDRREVEVLRVLLGLPPAQRALVESAAQGRFGVAGPERLEAAAQLGEVLDRLVPLGRSEEDLRGLAALDALALADPAERQRLTALAADPLAAGVRHRAVEAAARLTLLTAVPPSRDLHVAVLEGFGAQPAAAREPEAAYGGDYATPVLGTSSQRRVVGPPARPGAPSAAEAPSGTPGTPGSAGAAGSAGTPGSAATPGSAPSAAPAGGAPASPPPPPSTGAEASPAFAFRPGDEAERSRRARRRQREQARAARPRTPWVSRALAGMLAVLVLVLGGLLIQTRARLAEAEDFTDTWAALSLATGAEIVPGLSDNGTWEAVIAEDGLAMRAEGVAGWDGEVLELWGERDGVTRSLGALDLSRDGAITFTSTEQVDRLLVTREVAPGSGSGTPSSRVVATLDPELTGG